jgi:cytochrome c oxidase subunit 6b
VPEIPLPASLLLSIMPASEAKLKTTPLDPRFPNQNQSQHCWTRYNEYVLCLKNNDGDEDSCKKYFQLAASLCPSAWVRCCLK